MLKIVGIFAFLLVICTLGGCSSQNDLTDWYNNYNNSFVCEDNYIAYITDNNYLCIVDDNGAVQYSITNEINKIQGCMSFIVILRNDGTMQVFDTNTKSLITETETDTEYSRFNPAFNMIMDASGVSDFYYIYPDALLLKKNDSWYMGDNEINQMVCSELKKININDIRVIPNYYNFLVLENTGKISIVGNDALIDKYSKAMEWQDIVAFDVSEDTVVGVDSKGCVKSSDRFGVHSGNISEWDNIRMVSSENLFTVGLTKEGNVLVAEGTMSNNNLNRATEWKNIVYIDSSRNYILGIDANGKIWVTDRQIQETIDRSDCRDCKIFCVN